MKKITFLLFVLLFVTGCSNNPQSLAEKAVKTTLKKTVSAYEPITFGELSDMTLDQCEDYKNIKDSLSFYKQELQKTSDQFVLAANQAKAKEFKLESERIEDFYKNKRYKLEHKYKANNSLGELEEITKVFYLNADFAVVD